MSEPVPSPVRPRMDAAEPTAATGPVAGPPVKSFVAHARVISAFTFLSRILGLARESVSAHFFGAGPVSVAFTVAFSIPNLFRKLFGEGALSAAFIPLYAQAIKKEQDEARAGENCRRVGFSPPLMQSKDGEVNPTPRIQMQRRWGEPHPTDAVPGEGEMATSPVPSASDFAVASVNLLCVILLGVTIIGELLIGACIVLFGDRMLADRILTLKFTAIMLPYVLLICGTAFLSSILQVHRRFAAPAFAPVILNICHIVVIVLGARVLGLRTGAATADMLARQTALAYWLCVAVLFAGVMQVMILWPSLRAVGFSFRWVRHFWTPQVRQMLKLSVPVAMGAGVLQLSVLMDKGISLLLSKGTEPGQDVFHFLGQAVRYPMESGAAARLNWAQFLYQFPLGVFAIALATAIFPGLGADALEKDRARFKASLRQGIHATLFEGLAASVGLIAVRYPAIRLLFQHGDLHATDTVLIARSLVFYAAAIWAYSLLQIINRAFYALHDTRTPLIMSIVNIAINLAVELPLVWVRSLGEAGMAVGTCISFAVQALLMLWILQRRIGDLQLGRLFPGILKMLLATAIMGVICFGVQWLPIYHANDPRRIVWAIQLFGLMALGATAFLGLCRIMGVTMMGEVRSKTQNLRFEI